MQKLKEQLSINGGGHTNAGGTYVITAPMGGYVVEKKSAKAPLSAMTTATTCLPLAISVKCGFGQMYMKQTFQK